MGSVRYEPLYLDNAKTLGLRKQGSDVELFNNTDALKLADLLVKLNQRPIVSKSANYTATSSDYQIIVDATAAARTITIPDSTSDQDLYNSTLGYGKIYNIKKTDSSTNSVTVQRSGTQTIDGHASIILTKAGESIGIQTDGVLWHIVSRYVPSTWPITWPHNWN